ncbi:HNH endonuclease [bacterium]|nr:HNH endonuclease [bacterium]
MERNIWIFGNPDMTEDGFPMPGDLTNYLRNDIFAVEKGRYRYTLARHADIIVLSRNGLAYGHFDIDEKVQPNANDKEAYPKVKHVYLVRKSTLYSEPVLLKSLDIKGLSFGYKMSEDEFRDLLQQSGGVSEFHKSVAELKSTVDLEKVLREVRRRLGQSEFRKALVAAYDGKCVMTGCNTVEALEAAHIVPYCETESNEPANGLLLRADVHSLFDAGLIGIEPSSLTIHVAAKILNTEYGELQGKPVLKPSNAKARPNQDAMEARWKTFQVHDD